MELATWLRRRTRKQSSYNILDGVKSMVEDRAEQTTRLVTRRCFGSLNSWEIFVDLFLAKNISIASRGPESCGPSILHLVFSGQLVSLSHS